MPSRARAFSNTQRMERSSSMIHTGFMGVSRAFMGRVPGRHRHEPEAGW